MQYNQSAADMERIALSSSIPPQSSVAIPGSKSYTNRALILASLAAGTSRLVGASPSEDSEVLARCLRLLGIEIESSNEGEITVRGGPQKLKPFQGVLDVGPAGTAMRFLTALCAAIPGADITLQGSARMHQRPIHDLVIALRDAGATIEYLGTEGSPPLRIRSVRRLRGNALSISGATSSQFISAVALVTPLFEHGVSLEICGQKTSTSYIDMTLQSLADFGVIASREHYKKIKIAACDAYAPRLYQIEGDASGASYLWGIAALSGTSVTVLNVNPNSAQGDIGFPKLLECMGCSVTYQNHSITVRGPDRLLPIEANMELMPDTAQTLAVIAACAQGASKITGLKTLRIKETDRIQAMQTELHKVGVSSEAGPDYLIIRGSRPTGGRIATYEDHRMAMSFAMLACRTNGIVIEKPEVVAKSFPTFWRTLDQLGIRGEYHKN
jgi:3-phosphoshikimate 1-carboxyvinyltransferase